jgi:hypothetical protein
LPPDPERGLTHEQREALRHDFMLRDLAFETPLARRLRKEQEAREREEQEAREAAHQREIEREALQLKAELASLRFELVMAEFRRKAGFNPQQPRVPAGSNIQSGRWTRVAASGKLPPTLGHNSGNVDIPPERPEDPRERTGAVRAAARILARIPNPIARAAALLTIFEGASWLRERQAEIETSLDPPKSLQELHDAVAVDRPGTHKHHIVEQTPADEDGYPRSKIDAPDNLVRIPKQKHEEISSYYQTKNRDACDGLSPREWLGDKSWEERRQFGLDALIKFKVLKP